jgi:hypothetical protein
MPPITKPPSGIGATARPLSESVPPSRIPNNTWPRSGERDEPGGVLIPERTGGTNRAVSIQADPRQEHIAVGTDQDSLEAIDPRSADIGE